MAQTSVVNKNVVHVDYDTCMVTLPKYFCFTTNHSLNWYTCTLCGSLKNMHEVLDAFTESLWCCNKSVCGIAAHCRCYAGGRDANPHIKLWPGPFCLPAKSGLPPGTCGLSGNRGGGRSGRGRLEKPRSRENTEQNFHIFLHACILLGVQQNKGFVFTYLFETLLKLLMSTSITCKRKAFL